MRVFVAVCKYSSAGVLSDVLAAEDCTECVLCFSAHDNNGVLF